MKLPEILQLFRKIGVYDLYASKSTLSRENMSSWFQTIVPPQILRSESCPKTKKFTKLFNALQKSMASARATYHDIKLTPSESYLLFRAAEAADHTTITEPHRLESVTFLRSLASLSPSPKEMWLEIAEVLERVIIDFVQSSWSLEDGRYNWRPIPRSNNAEIQFVVPLSETVSISHPTRCYQLLSGPGVVSYKGKSVWASSHLVPRLQERVQFENLDFHAAFSVTTGVEKATVIQYEGSLLVPYLYHGYKIGYMVLVELPDRFVITTFLFILMDGTPEGDRFFKALRIGREDAKALNLDKVDSLYLAKDPYLRGVLQRCGLDDFISMSDIFSEAFKIGALPKSEEDRLQFKKDLSFARSYFRLSEPDNPSADW